MNQNFVKSHKLQKWLKWMETIHNEIRALVLDANIFCEVREIINRNSRLQKPTSFYGYLADSYISHSIASIRRQIKPHRDSISFVGLLEEIAHNPEELSRSYFESFYPNSEFGDLMKNEIDDFAQYADPSDTHVCAEMVKDDIDKLKEAANPCEEFADRRIAHHDMRGPISVPTFDEIGHCIKLLDKLYVKYHLLFYNEGMNTVMPTYQYDWKAIFREPWLIRHSG